MNPQLNAQGLLLLAFLTGGAINLSLISSVSLFLSTHSPLETVYLATVSSLTVAIFLHVVALREIKFSLFAAIATLCQVSLIMAIATGQFSADSTPYIWVVTSLIARILYKWILSDLTIRHLKLVRRFRGFVSSGG